MCRGQDGKGCEHSEKLLGKPEECMPEQIRERHGDIRKHPCVSERKPGERTGRE